MLKKRFPLEVVDAIEKIAHNYPRTPTDITAGQKQAELDRK
jgi:hypothetical protein